MKRSSLFFTSVLTGVLGVATLGCAPKAVAPMKLIPEGAVALAGVDLSALMATPMFKNNEQDLLGAPEVKTAMDAMKACKLDLTTGTKLLLGVADDQKVAFSLQSKGIGVEANVTCLAQKAKDSGANDVEFKDTNGKKSLVLGGGEGVCFLASADVLACASKDWVTDLTAILDGKGKSAVDGSLKTAAAAADQAKPIWFSAEMTGTLAEGLTGSPLEKAKSMSGSLDLTNGLAVGLKAGMGSPEDATALATEVNAELGKVLPLAPMVGVPKPVVDSVKVEAQGSDVTAAVAATTEELKTIMDAAKQMAG